MDRIELEQVSHTKFLGIIMNEYLDSTGNIKCCDKKVSTALFALRSARPYLNFKIAVLHSSLLPPK